MDLSCVLKQINSLISWGKGNDWLHLTQYKWELGVDVIQLLKDEVITSRLGHMPYIDGGKLDISTLYGIPVEICFEDSKCIKLWKEVREGWR